MTDCRSHDDKLEFLSERRRRSLCSLACSRESKDRVFRVFLLFLLTRKRKITKKNIDESKTDEIREIIKTITPIIMKVVNVEKKRFMSLGEWMDDEKIKDKP